MQNRRRFLKSVVLTGTGIALSPGLSAITKPGNDRFKLSLAEWSFHRAIQAGKMTNLEFPVITRELGIEAVEFVNTMFMDKARDMAYLKELNTICNHEGVKPLLIMCDSEGTIGHPDKNERIKTVENHKKWVDAAVFLGCHSIRINAGSEGSYEERQKLVIDGYRMLCDYGAKAKINVLIENHGGLSSNGQWLSEVMEMVKHERAGTLPDFGNFVLNKETGEQYDRYLGIKQLMPYAKGVSAKSVAFDKEGNETSTDYFRMMRIVKDSGYSGYIGIEYSGSEISEKEGVIATKKLIERAIQAL